MIFDFNDSYIIDYNLYLTSMCYMPITYNTTTDKIVILEIILFGVGNIFLLDVLWLRAAYLRPSPRKHGQVTKPDC